MFHRLTLHAADREASQRFYDTMLPTLGTEGSDFAVAARDGVTRRLHIGFVAASHAHVDEFWRTGTAGESGSFTLLSGTPTEHVELALDATEAAELVDADGNVARLVPTGC